MLDDDYTTIAFEREVEGRLKENKIKCLDPIFDAFWTFLDDTNALTIACAQGGDYIGGVESKVWKDGLSRKAMNVFFCKTDRPFKFFGRLNEDVSMYAVHGQRGELIVTCPLVKVTQLDTQQNAGGLTDIYKSLGTYVKSFYSVVFAPSCVRVSTIKGTGQGDMNAERIHHEVKWKNCTPMILSERYKKGDERCI